MKDLTAREKSYIFEKVADIVDQLNIEITELEEGVHNLEAEQARMTSDSETYDTSSWEYRYNADTIQRKLQKMKALNKIINYLNGIS